jgi:hypothetical protein
MTPDIIRAFLWRDVIRLGFSPKGDKNKSSWLKQYNQSLRSFWGIDYYPPVPSKIEGGYLSTIDCLAPINIAYEYVVYFSNKFLIRMMNPLSNLLWVHDYDDSHYSFLQDEQIFLCYQQNEKMQKVKRADVIKEFNRNGLEDVIHSLLTHPTPHQHIESPIKNHIIRIGGGIINPFLYLFHLRFQFCLDENRRKEEFNRLVELFETAIRKDNSIPIPVNDLMQIPE